MTTSARLPHGFVEKNRRDSSLAARENYNFEAGSATATVVYEGPWTSRQDFINDYLAKEVFDNNGTLISTKPAEYPHDDRLVVTNVAIQGRGKGIEDAQGITQYDRAELTVTYSTRNYSQDDSEDPQNDYAKGVYISEESDSHIEISTHMGSRISLSSDPSNNMHEDFSFHVPWIMGDFIIKQEFVITPRWLEINFMHGKVNDRPFITPAGRVVRTGTLRYDGLQAATKIDIRNIRPRVNTVVKPRWELTHRFSYNNRGWDQKPVANENVAGNQLKFGFAEVVHDNGDPLTPKADLSCIFFGFGTTWNPQALATIDALLIAIQNRFDAQPNGLDNASYQVIAGFAFDVNNILRQLGFNV